MAKTARQADSIISLKVALRDVGPPIWRRLLVPARMTLGDLHHAIQAAMGWEDAHLHVFDIAGRQYGDPREVDDVADEARLTVDGVLRSGVSRFTYTYDFGVSVRPGFQLPTCPSATVEPSVMSVRRDMPRHITALPGGGSRPRAR